VKRRTFHNYKAVTVAAGMPQPQTFEGNYMTIYTVTGTVMLRFGDEGDYVPAIANFTYSMDGGEHFNRVHFKSDAGGAVTCFYGYGKITAGGTGAGGGGGGGTLQVVNGAAADPNVAAILPNDVTKAAVYYQDGVESNLWTWGVTAQLWKNQLS
jgi:hypothetical protein